MFEITYRITTSLDYIKSLDENIFDKDGDFEGFICLNFNGNIYGYCPDRPLFDDETGWDLISIWFESLLSAVAILNTSSYVAVSDIDAYETWIEFKREDETVYASIVRADKNGMSCVASSPLENSQYGEWNNIPVSYIEFKNEILKKAKQYVDEIALVNQKLLKSSRLSKIGNLILEM